MSAALSGKHSMRKSPDQRGRAADCRADFQRHRRMQPITGKRHARANGEPVSGVDAENRPARDDLFDGENAIRERKASLRLAVEKELVFHGFDRVSRRSDQHCRSEASARGKIFAEKIIRGESLAPVDIACSKVDHQRNSGDVFPGFFGWYSPPRLANHQSETAIGI